MDAFSREIEQEIKDKGLTAPRVELAQIEALLATVTVKTQRVEGTNVIFGAALLPDGYMLGSGYSACVSDANFNEATGVKIATRNALADAEKKAWQLEGYLLRFKEQFRAAMASTEPAGNGCCGGCRE